MIRLRYEYPKHHNFICNRCTLCCGDTKHRVRLILLLKKEVACISKKTRLCISEFAERAEGHEPYLYRMRKTKDGKCVFLKKDSCSIYLGRPLICRFYPFELKDLREKRYAFSYTTECPGIGKGPRLKRDFFKHLFTEFMILMTEDARSIDAKLNLDNPGN